ncbi:S-adenosyl-L-methionine-dependent methyltransferase [Pseudovirgaria hyperparasitica]|uniref:S-adenosyl-L-methionine-dependent methyltransferase n=1 Tax=Pseudovirgaria hyperparasitica TaxID=470096 RepID=A0A6A6VWP8_9PEZI|nr:S-adenosyl-L-methionine-dependent methyltransferase [Pseudovirgaria hyperparasitica]KAF2754643.1 S-adenosyl-L-methionine-dependent methyltransferase [Pseudovirgaria hyperparasitica]
MSRRGPDTVSLDVPSLCCDLKSAVMQLQGSSPIQGTEELLCAAKQLVAVLEQPFDRMARLAKAPVGHAVLRTAINIGLFEQFYAGINHAEGLAARCGVEKTLLVRLMNVLVSEGVFEQYGPQQYKSTLSSQHMTLPGFRAVVRGLAETADIMPHLPDYLASIQYRNPSENKPGLFGFAKRSELSMFEWLEQNPEKLQVFQEFQSAKEEMLDTSFESLLRELIESTPPVKKLSSDEESFQTDTVLLCDVGGGRGTALRSVSTSIPKLSTFGRTITQDLRSVVESIEPCPEWEAMPYDFFEPQPVKGAYIYMLRDVLHNWSDTACLSILSNIIEAMGPKSQLLILDAVLPETCAPQFMTYIDIQMMQFGGMERTESHWRHLLFQVGLEVESIQVRNTTGLESMIRVKKI